MLLEQLFLKAKKRIEDNQIVFSNKEESLSQIEKTIKNRLVNHRPTIIESEYELLIDEVLIKEVLNEKIPNYINDNSINNLRFDGSDGLFLNGKDEPENTKLTEDEVFELAVEIGKAINKDFENKDYWYSRKFLDGSVIAITTRNYYKFNDFYEDEEEFTASTSVKITKPNENIVTLSKLVYKNFMFDETARLLTEAVKERKNILVAGNDEKLNHDILESLLGVVSNDVRIILIEDMNKDDLLLTNHHRVRLKTREDVTIRDLVKASLRMRPEIVIVEEIKNGEAFDILQAMNTGHDGSMTTLKLNSLDDLMKRFEEMILMNLELPSKFIKNVVEEVIDLIVFARKIEDKAAIELFEMKSDEEGINIVFNKKYK